MAPRRPAPKAAPRLKAPPPRRGRTLVPVIIGAALGAGALALVTLRESTTSDVDVVPTTSTPSTTAPPPNPATSTTTTGSTTPATTTTVTTTPPPTSTTEPPLQEIIVTVGRDDGPERVDQVALGAPVELRITNPDFDDEFHLHGYDLGNKIKVPAGETLTLSFVADRAGLFELESHRTHDVLLYLLVE